MAIQPETHEPPVSQIVSGIVQDAKKLFTDQLTLFKVEIKHDVERATHALIPLAIGMAVIIPALFLLGMAASHGLSEAAHMPLWGAYLIVGLAVAIIGTALCMWGKSMLAEVKPVNTALKGLEENVTWKTKN